MGLKSGIWMTHRPHPEKEGMSARDVALRTITFQAPGEETWRRPRKNTEREEMELMAVLGKP